MITLRYDIAAAWTGGTLYNTEMAETSFAGVSIDSRTLAGGELFIAIPGPRHDGHDYIRRAIDNGASGVLAEFSYPGLERIPGRVPVIAVESSHEAMIKLATRYRSQSQARFVGITGSNGKTTTREMTYHLLSAVDTDVYRSGGNLNNLYGVPLALFAVPTTCRTAIMELGISTAVEMPRLAEMVRPDVIAITNIGPSHLEFLASVQQVARAKLALVEASADTVPVIVNADDALLMAEAKKVRSDLITFALDSDADYRAGSITTDEHGATVVGIEGYRFRLAVPGRHQAQNLVAAYAICRTLGYQFDDVDTTALEIETAPMRGQRQVVKGVTFVVDCYNANPASMKAGLAAFSHIPATGRRILILGDMLELGADAAGYHRDIGKLLPTYDPDMVMLVGDLARHMAEGATAAGLAPDRIQSFATASQCAAAVTGTLREDDLVFLKASRGVGLEAVLDACSHGGDV